MATDFKALLGITAAVVEKPKPLPQGTYVAMILGFDMVESARQKTPGVQVNFRLVAPDTDVDQDDLQTAGGMEALVKRKVNTTFYLTDDATWRLKEFLEVACNLELGERSFAELLAEIQNMQVKLAITHRTNDKADIFMQVDKVLPCD